jgi:hypothetical protein
MKDLTWRLHKLSSLITLSIESATVASIAEHLKGAFRRMIRSAEETFLVDLEN